MGFPHCCYNFRKFVLSCREYSNLRLVGSLICAVAPTSVALIIGRAIAGAGGAGIFSGAFTVLAYIVPLRQRPIFFASVAAANAVASVAGPVAGGALTGHLTWR